MIELFYILWNADPEIISGFPPRWYGLLFASGFLVGSSIMTRIYKVDGRNPDEVERLTMWMVCLLYTSPSPRDLSTSRMPSSA